MNVSRLISRLTVLEQDNKYRLVSGVHGLGLSPVVGWSLLARRSFPPLDAYIYLHHNYCLQHALKITTSGNCAMLILKKFAESSLRFSATESQFTCSQTKQMNENVSAQQKHGFPETHERFCLSNL